MRRTLQRITAALEDIMADLGQYVHERFHDGGVLSHDDAEEATALENALVLLEVASEKVDFVDWSDRQDTPPPPRGHLRVVVPRPSSNGHGDAA